MRISPACSDTAFVVLPTPKQMTSALVGCSIWSSGTCANERMYLCARMLVVDIEWPLVKSSR